MPTTSDVRFRFAVTVRPGRATRALPLCLALLWGCSAHRPPAPRAEPEAPVAKPAQPAQAAKAELEARALLLLMADQRRFEPAALDAFLDGTPAIREALAVAAGAIGDPRGRAVLQGLMIDSEVAVRRAAAFAAGELAVAEARSSLIRAAVDDDRETGSLAVEALGKMQVPLAEVRRALSALDGDEGDQRLAPSLFRYPGEDLVETARQLLASPLPEVRLGAAYALGRVAPAGSVDLLRALLGDADPRLRAWGARGLGELGGPEDLARLEMLLEGTDVSPRIQALRAGAKILDRVSALAPSGWGDRLSALVRDPLPGVRATAIESSVPWLGSPGVRATVLSMAGNGEPRERELALLALARAGGEDAIELTRRASIDVDRFLRARAAEAAGSLGEEETLRKLLADSDPVVRVAATTALLENIPESALAETARVLFEDPDVAVRTAVFDALAEKPLVPGVELTRALERAADDRSNDARIAAVRALAARGADATVGAEEKAGVATVFERLGGDRDELVRREAAAGLEALGLPRPVLGPIDTGKTGPVYTMILEQTKAPRYVRIETDRGALTARLDCPVAPLTCLSFLQLAAQGYFDGTRFHRVVPDFVVQGGDPRGDGWGGPGYTLRDEINRLRYRRGALGMALSGPDTGGSQFFFTLSPQPHLDGGYTVFGAVVAGEPILDQIRQGDILRKIVEVSWNE